MTRMEFLQKLNRSNAPNSTKFNKQNVVSYVNILREHNTEEYNTYSLFFFELKLRSELKMLELSDIEKEVE